MNILKNPSIIKIWVIPINTKGGGKMTEKVPVKIDSRGRITVPKKAREKAGIEEGDILFMDLKPGKIEFTRAIEDPLVVLRDYSEKEYEKGKTRNIRKYAKDKDIDLDE